tara:strand:- start:13269 stop:14063 length:795 start_codon:yes stop_codon:yes gene_type:complete
MIIPFVVAAGAIGLVYALTGITTANASAKQLPAPIDSPTPPGGGGDSNASSQPPATRPQSPNTPSAPKCSPAELAFLQVATLKFKNGSLSLAALQRAIAIADKCAPQTAAVLRAGLANAVAAAQAKKEAAKAATPQKQLAIIITSPDAPPSPVPHDAKSGKALWKVKTVKGNKIVIPNFRPVLNLFKAIQSAVNAPQDGRIGDETIVKFRNLMTTRGFKKFPQTAPALAANVAKYLAVLSQNVNPTQVGRSGGSGDPSPFPGRN